MVRRARADEADAVAGVFLAARLGLLPDIPTVHPPEDARRWIGEVLFRDTAMWVATEDGAVVAMMSLEPGWIEHLYVHPAAQAKGIGPRLLEVAKASPEGAGGLELWTFQVNAGARRFYEKYGFEIAELTDG